MRSTAVLLSVSVVLMSSLACNLAGSPATGTPDLPGTITAQAETLAAPTATPPAEATSASAPEVSVTSNTNCRRGPSTDYDLVFTMYPGSKAQVVGKDTPDNYWIINNPTGGTCWLWGQYAVLTGDTSSVPEFPRPEPVAQATKPPKPTKTSGPTAGPAATATEAPPQAPGGFAQSRTCEGGYGSDGITPIWIEAVVLTWQDSNNETGYTLYKNNGALPTLPANSTSYNITLRYPQGTGGALYDNFALEAFNDAGTSSRPAVDVPRCP
jgi:hypothetical protein